jgi:hypothetical protein
MSEHDEENPIFEDFGLSTDDLTFAEPGTGAPADAHTPAEGEEDEAAAAAVEPAEGAEGKATPEAFGEEEPIGVEEEQPEGPQEELAPQKKPLDVLFHAQWIGAVVLCVIAALVFPLAHVSHAYWHSSYAVAMIALVAATWLTRKVWATFAVTALYTVCLAGALAALLTSVYWLGLELAMYDWNLTAKQGKQPQPPATAAASLGAKPASGATSAPAPPPKEKEKRK